MNKEYKIKLDLNKKLYNKKMAFNQFDENVNDFYIEVTKNNEVVKDLDKSIVTLVAIKPNGEVDAQFIEVKEGQIYADLKPSMCDLVGNYQAKAMIVLGGEIVTTDTINYSVNEDKIISRLNEDVVSDERFTLFTDALARLSDIEASEEQRITNEAERILAEENRKIEEAKRVETELIRQHEEADRTKYDAIRESNENIRKQNESIRLANETNRIDEEAKRVEEENKRKLAEEERKANYNFMTEDEERRRSEANAHKEAEVLRVQAETNRVNEEAKRRTTEQGRVSAENTRVSDENTRKANEVTRQTNETKRVEAETQRQNRYNSFISDAEANASNFENYTNNAKVKEEERKASELDRKSQEDRRVANEVERISNENTRKANEKAREKNETSRQNIFENKVDEVDEKIVELNTTKDNFISSVNTKVDNKISELDTAKSDMTNTVSNKIGEVETRFNALTSKQQQDAEVIDARDGETSLKARLDRDIEKAKQVYVNVEGSNISTDSSVGYAKDVEILGNTIQDANNLADIRSVGDKVEGQELYEIPVLCSGKNLFNPKEHSKDTYTLGSPQASYHGRKIKVPKPNTKYTLSVLNSNLPTDHWTVINIYKDGILMEVFNCNNHTNTSQKTGSVTTTSDENGYIQITVYVNKKDDASHWEAYLNLPIQLEEGTVATPYEPYVEDKLTILSPTPLEKVGDVADRIIEKDGVWGVEKNVGTLIVDGKSNVHDVNTSGTNCDYFAIKYPDGHSLVSVETHGHFSMINSYGLPVLWNMSDSKHLYLEKTGLRVYTDKGLYSDITSAKNYLDLNNLVMKTQLKETQFIPLPHSQQIKLRTFANKTNISFGCEIEGTIKAQVPKSLGATVNTHTEQINNLNKELDRVKKLEESTVSTVETESDFTTVEATSNGYFEDVKLEGKTLVNLVKENYTIPKTITGTIAHNKDLLKPNTEYTVSFEVVNNNLNEGSRFVLEFHSGQSSAKIRVNVGETGRFTQKITTFDVVSHVLWVTNGGSVDVQNYIILEGDHTQNPPSYFEGLKSVGDTTDEIVVSSVKGDGNLFDDSVLSFKLGAGVRTDYIPFKLKHKEISYMAFNEDLSPYTNINFAFRLCDKNKKEIQWFGFGSSETSVLGKTCERFKEVEYIQFFTNGNMTDTHTISNFVIAKDNTKLYKTYIPHQSDKKRLLYYNNETQAWEKPILRQWDSIEKHANGKYYYHKRSGEVVLNGSEDISINGSFVETKRFLVKIENSIDRGVVVCDKFSWEHIDADYEHIYQNSSSLSINILTSKLPTQDVQGFKQWLQANNVTVVYQLAKEKVYECTNIDLITYANETNYIVESGAIVPRTTLKVHNNISNVVNLLQKKVSLLESNVTSYMITQNRLMLASRYNADTVSFKVDVATLRNSFEYDNDLYELILNNILVGKDNYNREYIENLIIFYWMDFVISDEMYLTLFEIIEEQHNPKVIEAPIE